MDARQPFDLSPRLMTRLRHYVESMLLAEQLPPIPEYLTMLINDFAQLVTLSRTGKPILYKKRNTLSLLFDVFSVQSEMQLDCPDELVLGYTQSMMGFLLFQPTPQEIGMIGLGGGSLAKFCYRHLPDATITVAEIDPQVIVLRDWFHIPANDARLQVHCMDGAELVRQGQSRFDVLVIDGFDRDGQPEQLCSQDFYDDCYRAMAPGGIMVVNLLADELETDHYVDRIRRSFDEAVVVIDAPGSLNKIAFACKGDALKIDERTLQDRVEQLAAQYPIMLNTTAQSILQQRRTALPPAQISAQEDETVQDRT